MNPTNKATRELPIPPFFDSNLVNQVWQVPYEQRAREAQEWVKFNHLNPATTDLFKFCLLIVDVQNTFCLPSGELFVAGRSGNGAVEDNIRLCEFIYRNLGLITEIAATMDTHTSMQIFHAVFWINDRGEHPTPFTIIDLKDVEKGIWKVNPIVAQAIGRDYSFLRAHALHYVETLTSAGKYPLIIWPYHGMLGGIGHSLVASVEEACFFHAHARSHQTRFEIKGGNPLTENYSVLRPEVLTGPNNTTIDERNIRLIERLLSFDAIAITGQAKSHCVAWTIDDLLGEIMVIDPMLARKVYLIEDCTSPVVVPGVDFTDAADEAFRRFAQAGMHVVKSTDPITTWPGIKL